MALGGVYPWAHKKQSQEAKGFQPLHMLHHTDHTDHAWKYFVSGNSSLGSTCGTSSNNILPNCGEYGVNDGDLLWYKPGT